MKKLKIITIVGTRPEIIRLSEIIKKLDRYLNHKLIHTGQNYDYELNQVFFDDLGLKKPDFFLNINTGSLGKILGQTIIKTEAILKKEKPDGVLILGDTNSSISAIIAKRMRIPIFHMEAGNRSFDMNVPEEINRRIVDHVSDFNLVYTEHARRHLIAEGLPHRRIYLTGSPMNEVLKVNSNNIKKSKILDKLKLKKGKYFLVSVHRQENVDNKDNLFKIVSILNELVLRFHEPIIVSTHPRTRDRLNTIGDVKIDKKIHFLNPFGFFDYVKLQTNSKAVISDSGTISEESGILGFPAISLRNSMERPEAQDTGILSLTGLDEETVIQSILLTIDIFSIKKKIEIPQEYKIDNTSERVLKLISGNTKLSNFWWGIKN